MPIYAATITPAGVAAAAEVADGFFPVWMDPEQYHVFDEPIQKGFAAAGNNKDLTQFDIAPFVTVIMGDDVEQCMMPIRGNMALYIGGMGARDKNFYNDYAKRLGFEEAAVKIQDLYLAGKKDEAMAAVPAELIDACHLVGPGRSDQGSAAALDGCRQQGSGIEHAARLSGSEGSGVGRRNRSLGSRERSASKPNGGFVARLAS